MKRTWIWVGLSALVLIFAVLATYFFMRPQAAITVDTGCETAEVFTEVNYLGTSACLPVGDYTVANLSALGISNNSVSSFKVGSGYKIILYENDLYDGENRAFTADIKDLGVTYRMPTINGGFAWNNQAGSIRVQTTGEICAAAVYLGANYGSYGACFPVGKFNLSAMKARGLGNDMVYGFDLMPGYKITLWVNDNFSGATQTFETSVPNLDAGFPIPGDFAGDWNNETTSLEVSAIEAITPTVSLTANGTQDAVTVASGADVNLAWDIKNIGQINSTCTATPAGWFAGSEVGTFKVNPTQTTTYSITCSPAGETPITDQVVVTVGGGTGSCPEKTADIDGNDCKVGVTDWNVMYLQWDLF